MKNRKINFIKLGILLLNISLLLWNCNDDNLQSEIEQTLTSSIEKISVKDALKEISLNSELSKSFNKKQSVFNQINTNVKANKTTLNNSNLSYSFLLNPKYKKRLKNNELYFDNLIVTIDKNNNTYTHILRYIPTKNWLNNPRDLAKYSGKIKYLSNNRDILSSIELVEGELYENYNNKSYLDKKSQRSAGCQLKYVMTVCGALEDDDLSCTHFYELKCGSGSSSGGFSGEGFSDNGNYNNLDTNNENGFAPGGGGNSIIASPIIEEVCPEGMHMDSNGYCIVIEDPCKYIKLQTENPRYTEQAEELKSKTGLRKETGYKQNKDGTQIPLNDTEDGHSLEIPIDRNTVGFMHTHLNDFFNGEIDKKTGDPIKIEPIRIFSPADVIKFLQIVKFSKYNGVPTHLVYGTVIASTGNYTLRFTGNIDDITGLGSADSYLADYKKYFDEINNKEKAFLHFLKNKIGIKGINLYRIRDNGDIEKKTLNIDGKVNTNDCE